MRQKCLSTLVVLKIQQSVLINIEHIVDEFNSNGVGGQRKLLLK